MNTVFALLLGWTGGCMLGLLALVALTDRNPQTERVANVVAAAMVLGGCALLGVMVAMVASVS